MPKRRKSASATKRSPPRMAEPSFSAVLLAGGKSTRMGRDKALLSVPGSPLLFWQRQLQLLEALQPAEIFWSGAARQGVPAHVRPVSDPIPNAGPLAGISAALDQLRTDLLVVLAIDLIQMSAPFLASLLARCTANRGIVARHGDFYEPLAAVYPKSLRGLVSVHLLREQFQMQELVREGVERGLLEAFSIEQSDALLFRNFNSPADLS